MSEQFKVGEIAVGCNFQFDNAYNGVECEILSFNRGRTVIHAHVGLKVVDAYYVRFADGSLTNVTAPHLRKKRPPEDDDSEIRQETLDCIERMKRGAPVDA